MPRSIEASSAYIYAAQNQKIFDDFYYDLMNLNPGDFSGLPRPTKWASSSKYILLSLKTLSKIMSIFWLYLLFYIYIIFRFIRLSANQIRRPIYNPDTALNSINLLICNRSHETLSHIKISKCDLWLKAPLINLRGKKPLKLDGLIVDACHVLSFSELIACLLSSVRVHWRITMENNHSLGMQTYNSLDWMVTWFALCKLKPSKITTSEHHDRWAVLADSYCSGLNHQVPCVLVLAQHGREYESTYSKIKELTGQDGLPYKLKNLTKLYVYNSAQAEIFKKNIIDASQKKAADLEIMLLSARLNLAKIETAGLSVLIVGHRMCENLQILIYRFLVENGAKNVYYKPHPTVKASNKAKAANWLLISDHDFFPCVDFIVSYPSTLVDEYLAEGIPAVQHEMNQSIEDKNLINNIKSMITNSLAMIEQKNVEIR